MVLYTYKSIKIVMFILVDFRYYLSYLLAIIVYLIFVGLFEWTRMKRKKKIIGDLHNWNIVFYLSLIMFIVVAIFLVVVDFTCRELIQLWITLITLVVLFLIMRYMKNPVFTDTITWSYVATWKMFICTIIVVISTLMKYWTREIIYAEPNTNILEINALHDDVGAIQIDMGTDSIDNSDIILCVLIVPRTVKQRLESFGVWNKLYQRYIADKKETEMEKNSDVKEFSGNINNRYIWFLYQSQQLP
jgi:cell division protein FtsL